MEKQRTTNRLDLTEGPILKTLVRLAVPVTVSMVLFTVYLLVDLYFVGRLGPDAVAALSISSNAFFIHLGFSTVLGTGGMVLIAQAFGRKDYTHAANVFKQSILMALVVGVFEAVTGLLIAPSYIKFFGGTGKSLLWGIQYFQVFSISFLFMILLYVIGNCLRGMGNTKTPMIIMLQANKTSHRLLRTVKKLLTLHIIISWKKVFSILRFADSVICPGLANVMNISLT